MKKVLIASGVAFLALATIAGAQTTTFSSNLTVGSTGSEVVALQNWLINNGYGIPSIQSGAATPGYFGAQTKSAVAAYQKAVGLPAFGYFGPMTRAKIAGGTTTTGGTTAVACPAGYTCTAIPGTTTGTTPVVGTQTGITTPGIEGSMTVTSGPVSGSTAYEGDTMVPILAFKAEAKTSDIAIQRIKLDLGTNTKIYNKIYSKVYVTDGTATLASIDLNSSTVVKNGSRYEITIPGINYVVPKNTVKTLVIKADVRSTIDTGDLASYTVSLAASGVRGVDGAGIDQYAPTLVTDVSKGITISGSLSESAQLTLATDSSSPLTQTFVASQGSDNNELDKLTLLVFTLKADKDDVKVTDLVATITSTGPATASTTYLFDGSTLVDSVSNSGTTATFTEDFVVPKGTTKTYSLKVDVRGATSAATTFTASVTNANVTAENTIGDTVTNKSGSATSANILARKSGPEITLAGTTISKSTVTNSDVSTTTGSVTFNLRIKALGDAIRFGTQAASSTFTFGIYKNNVKVTTFVASSTTFSIPDNANISGLGATDAFEIPRDQEVLVPATFTFDNRLVTGALLGTTDQYKVGLEGVNWTTATAPTSVQSSTFMAGQNAWRSGIVLP